MGSSASSLKAGDFSKQSTNMLCSICSLSLNIFSRKKCTTCQQFYCSKCLHNSSTLLPKFPKLCQKCFKLSSGKLTSNDLEVYSVKELRHFLSKRQVPINNCFEKSDLVALVLKTVPQGGTKEDLEHKKHVQSLKERMEKLMSSSSRPSDVNLVDSQIGSQTVESISDEALRVTGTPIWLESTTLPNTEETLDMPDVSTGTDDQVENFSQESPSQENVSVLEETDDLKSEGTQKTNEMCFKSPITLEDIKDIADVNFLNIRQMKELLTRNFVNYKGCCEKKELSTMIVDLWKEHSRNQSVENLEGSSRDDICKICMDQVIDCVLLECGHMVACKKCGKQLAECPICRKYVSRVVHVFRS